MTKIERRGQHLFSKAGEFNSLRFNDLKKVAGYYEKLLASLPAKPDYALLGLTRQDNTAREALDNKNKWYEIALVEGNFDIANPSSKAEKSVLEELIAITVIFGREQFFRTSYYPEEKQRGARGEYVREYSFQNFRVRFRADDGIRNSIKPNNTPLYVEIMFS